MADRKAQSVELEEKARGLECDEEAHRDERLKKIAKGMPEPEIP